MSRPVILGNGGLTVGIDENGFVHDFYYPYVGLENLTTARSKAHHIGIWVNGDFTWLSNPVWKKSINFSENALISNSNFKNDELNIEIKMNEFVDSQFDVFARKVTIVNNSEIDYNVRLFFHQVFQISARGRGDTAMYVPDGNYILDYKGHCSLLIYAETDDGTPFDQYAAGGAGVEGKEGTFKDAEDGELSMSAVEHGGVDSTIRLSLNIKSKSTRVAHYWIVVSNSQQDLEIIHKNFLNKNFDVRLNLTFDYWQEWLAPAQEKLNLLSDNHKSAALKSLLIIKAHIDDDGGIIASADSSIYNYGRDYYSYVWPRDGAFAIWPLIKLGYTKEAKNFFNFCVNIMHPDGYMMHKYQPDQAIGSTWHPLIHGNRRELAIQEDETAILLIMLKEYENYSADTEYVDGLYNKFIKPTANFMSNFIDEQTGLPHASYDLWEEKFLTTTYTSAATYKALIIASEFGHRNKDESSALKWHSVALKILENSRKLTKNEDKIFTKGFLYKDEEIEFDNTLDVSSFYGAWRFGFNSDNISATYDRIQEVLMNKSPSGGSPRYEYDNYFKSDPAFKGNPWFVTTLWIGQYQADNDMKDAAKATLEWTLSHSLKSGVISEQINPSTGDPVSVTPLVWSHAELLNLIIAILL